VNCDCHDNITKIVTLPHAMPDEASHGIPKYQNSPYLIEFLCGLQAVVFSAVVFIYF